MRLSAVTVSVMAPKSKASTKKAKKKDIKDDDEDLSMRMRNVCAVVNNYTEADVEKMKVFFANYCSYGIFAFEVGEKGTPHLQMYFELLEQKSIRQIRKLTPEKIANIERGYAPDPKARAGYCKKGTDPKKPDDNKDPNYYLKYWDVPGPGYEGYEHGEITNPRARNDLKKEKERIKSGEVTVRQLRDENPQLIHQYGRVLQDIEGDVKRLKYRHPNNPPFNFQTKGIWLNGKTGVGKSHAAYITLLEDLIPGGYHPDKVYNWDKRQKFQCGYEQQEVVIINEYKGPKEIEYGILLELLDKWPYAVERKNPLPNMQFVAHTIIFTSIFHPKDVQWNLQSGDDLDQLLDRIEVKEMTGENRRKRTQESS